jgi:hypothetical protein
LTFQKITKVEFYKYSQKNGEKQVEIVSSCLGWNDFTLKFFGIDTPTGNCNWSDNV